VNRRRATLYQWDSAALASENSELLTSLCCGGRSDGVCTVSVRKLDKNERKLLEFIKEKIVEVWVGFN
jgi:hypothetical protein